MAPNQSLSSNNDFVERIVWIHLLAKTKSQMTSFPSDQMGERQLGRLPEFLLGVRRRPRDQLDDREDGFVVQRYPQHTIL
jgi:hypothetical protein